MPGLEEVVGDGTALVEGRKYGILRQRVDLDVDFATQSLKGSTEITVQPFVRDLREIRLHCRQCKPTAIQVNGITARYEYEDPYGRARLQGDANVHQHHMLKQRVMQALSPQPAPELAITLPSKLKIQELHLDPANQLPVYNGLPSLQKQESDAMAIAETPTGAGQQGPQFAPIKLFIEFEVASFRDGLHWVGCEDGDKRFPYVYTKIEPWAGNTSCIFPCLDDATSRCSWELSIRCPRTSGDAFRKEDSSQQAEDGATAVRLEPSANGDVEMVNGDDKVHKAALEAAEPDLQYIIDLSEDDAALDLAVVCIGDQTDDVVDSEDDTRRTVTFTMNEPVTARHVGFAIGPFERIDLSSTRDAGEEERLGQSAVRVQAFCLPGRGEEVRNTCFPLTKVIDHFGVNYGSFSFSSYQALFVDDLVHDTAAAAGLTFCASRLLFSEDVIEPLETNTRILIRAVADQWAGVSVIAKESTDAWAVAGIAGYMSDLYGKVLFGNNAYRWQQKLASAKVYEQDVDRPAIYHHGPLLHLDPSIREFLDLKSALVLFILDRRLVKASGNSGCQRIINRIFLQTKTGALENGELSTAEFQRICERFSHGKLEAFFKQWVFWSGCPIFYVQQKFNKKKLVVDMTISQRQTERTSKPPFAPNNFMREIKEYVQEVWAPEVQPVFTGPMTIRIHEADGTPYEHIVEIKEQTTKLEIPYNTKYKRLKRSRRQKERVMADGVTGEGEDALLYCLGDILDSKEEVKDWNLLDWTEEDEEKMGQESYEWIRMDADFEWIGNIHLIMPLYMYISQLQQDRDVVAQYESMKWLMGTNPHHISLSIMLRTLMDRRYFHGIRTMAADGIAELGTKSLDGANKEVAEIGRFHLEKAFQELFCFPDEVMPKPNDFSDRTNYIIQCAIPRAMAKLRDRELKVPTSVRRFFVDKLKFNDNSENPFSDCHYVATLMSCLADSLVASHREVQPVYTFSFGGADEEPEEPVNPDEPFEREAIDEIERYRRIDEWITTYHNTYSVTALECLQKLTKAGLAKDKTKEVLQYTRPTNADLVRLQAFKCLTETGLTRKMTMLRYLLHSIADDPSPYFRNRLLAIFGEALGHIALGDPDSDKAAAQQAQVPADPDGLVLEQEATSEQRHLEVTRKTTPEGAIAALKLALEHEDVFKKALWRTATSKLLTLDEVGAVCDVAALLFRPIASCRVTLKLPPMYTAKHLGNAKVRFTPRRPFRTRPVVPLALEDWRTMQGLGLKYTGPKEAEPVIQQRRKSSLEEEVPLKLQLGFTQPAPQMAPPATPTPTTEGGAASSGFKLKLGVGGGTKRKSSADPASATSMRAGSPKAQKLSRQHTPTSAYAASPPPSLPVSKMKRSPSVVSQRRGSTSSLKGGLKKSTGRFTIKLKFGAAGWQRVQAILSSPSQPGGARPVKSGSRSITPVMPQQRQEQPQSSLFPPSLLQSPTGSGVFSTSPMQTTPVMNLGGFRSYGPPATAPVPEQSAPSPDVQPASTLFSPTNGTGNSLTPVPPSVSPPAVNEGMLPPPKPKLKLKLGGRKSSTPGSAGSP